PLQRPSGKRYWCATGKKRRVFLIDQISSVPQYTGSTRQYKNFAKTGHCLENFAYMAPSSLNFVFGFFFIVVSVGRVDYGISLADCGQKTTDLIKCALVRLYPSPAQLFGGLGSPRRSGNFMPATQ